MHLARTFICNLKNFNFKITKLVIEMAEVVVVVEINFKQIII